MYPACDISILPYYNLYPPPASQCTLALVCPYPYYRPLDDLKHFRQTSHLVCDAVDERRTKKKKFEFNYKDNAVPLFPFCWFEMHLKTSLPLLEQNNSSVEGKRKGNISTLY